MASVQATSDDVRPRASTSGDQTAWRAPELDTSKNWRWYDPPILFPIGLMLLTVSYALLRAPQ